MKTAFNPFTKKLDMVGAEIPADMGIYVGTVEPTLKTYTQWLSSRTGYWAWIDISGEVISGVTATVMSVNAVGSINPLAADFARYVTAVINPANAAGSIAALVASTSGVVNETAEVMPVNATGMISALTAAYTKYITASVGAAEASGSINALVATVVSGGSTKTTINGLSYLGAPEYNLDTGTESNVNMSGGQIQIDSHIVAPSIGFIRSALYVDGVERDFSTITAGQTLNDTLVYTPSTGTHSIRVLVTTDDFENSDFQVDNFRIPIS